MHGEVATPGDRRSTARSKQAQTKSRSTIAARAWLEHSVVALTERLSHDIDGEVPLEGGLLRDGEIGAIGLCSSLRKITRRVLSRSGTLRCPAVVSCTQ